MHYVSYNFTYTTILLQNICLLFHPPSPSKLSLSTSCTASSLASRVCSRHVSPLSERRITISRSMPRRDPKCGTSMITGLEESSYTKMVYFIGHRKTQTTYYIILKQKLFLFLVVIHHECGSLSPRHGASLGCGWRNGLQYGG